MKSRVKTYTKKEIGWLCGGAMEEKADRRFPFNT